MVIIQSVLDRDVYQDVTIDIEETDQIKYKLELWK
jgi:hypothetical protein